MNDKFVTAHSFSDTEEAEMAAAVLKENSVAFYIEEARLSFDATFSYKTNPYSVHLKVKEEDIGKVLELLDAAAREEGVETTDITLASLFESYSDEELLEVVSHRDEWKDTEVQLAEQILDKRGITLSENEKRKMWKDRVAEVRKPQKGSIGWLIFGFVLALMGGLFGIMLGFAYCTLKGKDPEGNSYFIYDDRTRTLGLLMTLLGILVIAVLTYYGWIAAWLPWNDVKFI